MLHDHLSEGEQTGWFVRDVGLGPAGVPWITLPEGDVSASGMWRVLFYRWMGACGPRRR